MNPDLPSVKTFKPRWRVRLYAYFMSLMTLPFAYFLVFMCKEAIRQDEPLGLLISVPVLLMLPILPYWALRASGTLTLEPDHFRYQSLLGTTLISYSSVKGYRLNARDPSSIQIGSKDEKIPSIWMLSKVNEEVMLMQWIKANFPELTAVERQEDETQMLQDPNLGATTQDRQNWIANAKHTATRLNVLSIGVGLWAGFLPGLWSLLAAMAVIIFNFFSIYTSNGAIRINYSRGSAHPSVAFGLFAVSFSLCIRGIFTAFDLVSRSHIPWVSITVGGVTLTVLMLLCTREFDGRKPLDIGNVLAMLVLFWIFWFGVFLSSNKILDQSTTKKIRTLVTDKEIITGRNGQTYYVYFESIGLVTDKRKEVTGSFYDQVEKGDSVTLNVHDGFWNCPWYIVTK